MSEVKYKRSVILMGRGTKEYIRNDIALMTSKETMEYVVTTMARLMATTNEEITRCLEQAFQDKIMFNPEGNEENTILYRPDELKVYFRSKFGLAGIFEITLEDIDVFFDGKEYTLCVFTEEEMDMVRRISSMEGDIKKIIGNKFSKEGVIPVALENTNLEEIDFNQYPGKPPLVVYAEKLKCSYKALADAIAEASEEDNDEGMAELDGVELGKVMVQEDEAHIFNISGGVFGMIPLKVLFEIDENGQGYCPCPECWKARHTGELEIPFAQVKPTLH